LEGELRAGLRIARAGPPFHQAIVVVTGRAFGDVSVPAGGPERLSHVLDTPVAYLSQVHSATVVALGSGEGSPGTATRAGEGDAIVAGPGAKSALAVFGADCPVLGLVGDDGVIAAVHAGWRGLVAGVVRRAAEAMRERGARYFHAVLGPHVCRLCYEFGEDLLEGFASRWGKGVVATSRRQRPSLDLARVLELELEAVGAQGLTRLGGCTACGQEFFSWRKERASERHALVVVPIARS
jgi:copper oxidase (laccase) domain-containing protein